MTSDEKARWICERARALGFELCGVVALAAGCDPFGGEETRKEFAHFSEWLRRGYAGEMKYLDDPRRTDPRRILQDARSLLVVAMNYNSPPPSSSSDARQQTPRGWISRYAWGEDYHQVMQDKLRALVAEIRARYAEPFEARTYVDTGPILERVAAKYAGLGWLAKNTCLINAHLGSWLFLGVIVTTLDLEPTLAPGETPAADLCGSCTRCLEACPTQAFPEPYVLDARLCISYLTIELRGSIPEALRPRMGDAVIGCDICQDVCPWNRKAPLTTFAPFHPRDSLFAPEIEPLASLSPERFSDLFQKSAAKRAKWRGLVRNACVALGNCAVERGSATHARIEKLLDALAASNDPLIAEHAHWALSRLSEAH
ncbi:MAG TPA: tRNA epoxyqueuosine(34) reductase QueG [Candidatus Acidoferrales bacterium]|nr:tRNA epoxyqueuosine(34) reductase QueG [Candidatus Acidoferrales bacterium]